VSAEVLAALARKYRTLAGWRAARDAGASGATRAELRALAAEFPGCLRELDTLGRAELERRAAVCARAEAEPVTEPETEQWTAWIAAYHALMRAALRIRAGARTEGEDVPAGFAEAVMRPPGGRVAVVVLRAVAARFDVPAATVAATLFPVRRASPYRL
jgi:hypothetical protein